MMGFTDSPYHAFQAFTWANTIALGDRRKKINRFRLERVVVNLMVSEGYECKLPWVYKKREDVLIAADLFIYVDDGRPIGPTEDIFCKALREWVSMCSCIGIHNSYRKVTPPLQEPGPWAGTVTTTDAGYYGLVSQYQWDKT